MHKGINECSLKQERKVILSSPPVNTPYLLSSFGLQFNDYRYHHRMWTASCSVSVLFVAIYLLDFPFLGMCQVLTGSFILISWVPPCRFWFSLGKKKLGRRNREMNQKLAKQHHHNCCKYTFNWFWRLELCGSVMESLKKNSKWVAFRLRRL